MDPFGLICVLVAGALGYHAFDAKERNERLTATVLAVALIMVGAML